MGLDTFANRQRLTEEFPALGTDPEFKVTSEATVRYNCIAWAMGFDDRWVAPPVVYEQGWSQDDKKFVWWPEGVADSMDPTALKEAFVRIGFEECEDAVPDNRYDKVRLYSYNGEWTHASRIIDDNVEHSKCGELFDCRHSVGVFDKTYYGTGFAIMRRPVDPQQTFIDRFPILRTKAMINAQCSHNALTAIIEHFNR